jgi:hypothetical protein
MFARRDQHPDAIGNTDDLLTRDRLHRRAIDYASAG